MTKYLGHYMRSGFCKVFSAPKLMKVVTYAWAIVGLRSRLAASRSQLINCLMQIRVGHAVNWEGKARTESNGEIRQSAQTVVENGRL